MEPTAFPKLVHNEGTINEQLDAEHQSESSDAEDQSESGDEESMSKSPAFNPTSPATMSTVNSYATSQPSTVKSAESSSARTQGPRTILEFTPVREPEPAVKQEHTKKSDMSMFTVPITMNSAQVQSSNWMIDSGAGMSGTSSTNNLKNTMRCKIPITPAFGSVMDATSEGTINDQTLGPLGIRACGVTLTVLTYSTFSYVTSTPVNPDHSLLSVTNLVNVATFTHFIACLFTAVTYNKI